ncbi:MAG: DUF5057 domain-containing protein [Acetatifactor sp.]|nr:DUF5057 domain-containing protein [Acetatifactor sp.]
MRGNRSNSKTKYGHRVLKRVITGILSVCIIGGGVYAFALNDRVLHAQEVFRDTEVMVQEKIAGGKSFNILEIVSAPENARIGYLVGGCEPTLDDTAVTNLEAEGILTRDAASASDHPLVLTTLTEDRSAEDPELLAAGYTEEIVYDDSVSGGSVSGGSVSGGSVSAGNPPVYRYTKQTVVNREFFKRYVLGMTGNYESLRVNVTTKTPGELTADQINSADLIYINGLNADGYRTLSMPEDTAIALLGRITADEASGYVPCIIDFAVYDSLLQAYSTSSLADPNLFKVMTVLMTERIDDVYAQIASGFSEGLSSERWKSVLNAVAIANSGNFVNGNVFWCRYSAEDFASGIGSSQIFVSEDLKSYYSQTAISNGFYEVQEYIDEENYNNSINYPTRETMNMALITPAMVAQYIINFSKEGTVLYKNNISVLELQPCKDFNFGDTNGKAQLINKWIPGFADKADLVNVTCMTINEYIGHNDDILEQYDLVYIGSNTGFFNMSEGNVYTSSAGNATERRSYRRFNDPSMNGLIYSHVGDLGNVQYWGLIKTDRSYTDKTYYRFPGIDLTTYKLAELKEYLDGGNPVIVADDFFTYGNSYSVSGEGAPTAINGGINISASSNPIYGILDTSSYMYELVVYAMTGQAVKLSPDSFTFNWSGRKHSNFFNESTATASSLVKSVNQQKLFLNLTSRPTEYAYTTKGSYLKIDKVNYLQPSDDGNYYLTYEMSISSLGLATGGQTFDCKLFIDVNNDGKFSKTQEEMDSLVITDLSNGAVLTKSEGAYRLMTGNAYRVSRILPKEYFGCVAWEIMVMSNSDSSIRDSEKGYTVVKSAASDKTTIKILQITSGEKTYEDGKVGWAVNSNNLNLEKQLSSASAGSLWHELLSDIPDFELDITTIPTYGSDGLIARFKAAKNEGNNLFDEYDMLIFGFGDGFADIRYKELLDAIRDYADSGHSILWAHDDTFVQASFLPEYYDYTTAVGDMPADKVNYFDRNGETSALTLLGSTDSWQNNEKDSRPRFLTQYVRQISGMDTYGVTVNGSPARSGQEISKYDANGNVTADWKYLVDSGKDIAYKPNTYQTKTVPNTQGATTIQLREWILPRFAVSNWGNLTNAQWYLNTGVGNVFEVFQTKDGGQAYTGNDQCESLVGKINDGTITNYPYKIPDNFYASNTHSQYWALDIETDDDGDGESDLVVWYAINDYTTDTNDVFTDDLCSISPNDARNNYYIYNMGNVTYTGVGHTGFFTESEVKLFINTMVASYTASIKDPSVNIIRDLSGDDASVEYMSIPYWAEDVGTDSLRVFFKVRDDNIVKGTKKITVDYDINGMAVALDIYNSNGVKLGSGSSYSGLESESRYYVDIPISKLNATQGADVFRINLKTDWVRNGKEVSSKTVSDTVTISKLQLFDLD